MAVGFKCHWLKVAFRFFAKQYFNLAVASAICHCSALWLEREGAVEAKSGCLIGQGSGLTRLVLRASGGQVSFGV